MAGDDGEAGGRRRTGWPTVALGGVLALAYASTLTAHPGLGDSPETVAGVRVLGILHAPGYAAYVAVARLVTALVPLGPLALRLNVLSALCTVVAALLVAAVARRMGASPIAAAIGAAGYGLAASVWFYAGFAKHDAFSGLLVALAVWLLLDDDLGARRAALAGVVVGASVGAGWFAMVAVVPAAVVVARRAPDRRRVAAALVGGAGAAAVVVLVATVVRSGQDPALAWGRATGPGRLLELLTLRDFGVGGGTSQATEETAATSGGELVAVPVRLVEYLAVLGRDLGPPTAVLAVLGGYWSWRSAARIAAIALAVVVGVNLLLVAAALGVDIRGLESGLVHGGFVAPTLLVAGVWAGLGAQGLLTWTARLAERPRTTGAVVAVVLALAVVVPSAVVHRGPARHPARDLDERFARDLLADVAPDGVVVVGFVDHSFPVLYAQEDLGHRRDVDVVAADGLTRGWYRDQVEDRLGVELRVPAGEGSAAVAAELVARLRPDRPVYLDAAAQEALAGSVGYRPLGLVGEVVDGDAIEAPADPTATTRRLVGLAAAVPASEVRRWPGESLLVSYRDALVRTARWAELESVPTLAEPLYEAALRLDPDDETIEQSLERVRAG